MACNPSSTTGSSLNARKRKRESSTSTSEEDISAFTTDSANSSGSGGSDESIERSIPKDISRWTEEHLIGLSIITSYQVKTTPLDLLKMFPQEYSRGKSWIMSKYFLPNHIDDIEIFFKRYCNFNKSLDEEFQSLTIDDATYLRNRNRYNDSREFLASGDFTKKEEMQCWFRRYHMKIRF